MFDFVWLFMTLYGSSLQNSNHLNFVQLTQLVLFEGRGQNSTTSGHAGEQHEAQPGQGGGGGGQDVTQDVQG